MKTIKNSKEITTLEVDDVVVFGDLKYKVRQSRASNRYYLHLTDGGILNSAIFDYLHLDKRTFVESIGIHARTDTTFPETKSLEALTAIVSALFKEYEKQTELPKTWEEFCERNWAEDDYYISNCSYIIGVKGSRDPSTDKNLCTSRQEAEAHLAFIQLRQLRKCYIDDWEPDWTNSMVSKYGITSIEDVLSIINTVTVHRSMSFPTKKLAEQFLTNFKDLLEIAKPLL